tara:strand:+ start:942 stop:2654 length:1713 start_codon:yes stop_codon:yes gene_type:complete
MAKNIKTNISNFKPILFFSSLLIALILSSTPLAVTGEPSNPNNGNPVFRILTEEFPPYNYSEKGKAAGISTEIVRGILKRLNHTDNIEVMPWVDGYKLAQEKDNIILFSTTRTPFREDLFKWVGPLVPNNSVFFARKGSGISVNSLDEAKKLKSIGVYKDAFAELLLKKKGFTNLDTVVDNRENVKKLVDGKIDLWAINELTGKHMAMEAGLDDKIESVYTVEKRFMYLAFSKSTPDLVIEKWQGTLDEIKLDGTYSEIFSKWLMLLSKKPWITTKQLIIPLSSILFVLGIISILAWNRTLTKKVELKTGELNVELKERKKTEAELKNAKRRSDDLLTKIIPIGLTLFSESVFDRLLEKILLESMSFSNADAGSLYRCVEEDLLKFEIVRTSSLGIKLGGTSGNAVTFKPVPMYDEKTKEPNHSNIVSHAALTGSVVNIPDAYQAEGFNFSGTRAFDNQNNYRSISHLTVPLINSSDKVIGVFQLINALDETTGKVVSFSKEQEKIIEILARLAAAALDHYIREKKLKDKIRELSIKIDKSGRDKKVKEITESDYFQSLQEKIELIRQES